MFYSPISCLCEYQLQGDARKKNPTKTTKKKKNVESARRDSTHTYQDYNYQCNSLKKRI